jgi:prolyl-tRNA synthetase
LNYAIVDADSGNIGGNTSQEFQVLSDVGEDLLLSCQCGKYAANVERAVGSAKDGLSNEKLAANTPSIHVAKNDLVQAIQQHNSKEPLTIRHAIIECENSTNFSVYVVIRGHRRVNEVKLKSAFQGKSITMTPEKLMRFDPRNSAASQIVIDSSLASLFSQFVPVHEDDISNPNTMKVQLLNVREAEKGDLCIRNITEPTEYSSCCKNTPLEEKRGIEVGHVFYLGTKYSDPFELFYYVSTTHKELFHMGCYGIGVSRLIQTIVETSNDEHGIIWPISVAPFRVCIVPISVAKPKDMKIEDYEKLVANNYEQAKNFATQLQEKFPDYFYNDVMVDDREENPPVKLKDAMLIGYPYVVTVGKSFVSEGKLEVYRRGFDEMKHIPADNLLDFFAKEIEGGFVVPK